MEALSFIFNALSTLADRIINVEKTKIQDRQTLFNEIAKPLFEELEPVASNYMGIFRNARKKININTLKELRELLEFVGDEREVMLMTRKKVIHMADRIREYIRDDDVDWFAAFVLSFFQSGGLLGKDSRTSYFLGEMREIEARVSTTGKLTSEDKEFITKYIDRTLAVLEDCWSDIVQAYEKLKIYSVSPPKFVKKLPKKSTKSR